MRTGGTVAIAGVLLTLPLVAQSGSATLAGMLRDLTGTGLPHAHVELQSTQPVRTFDTVTDNFGEYGFTNVPAAEYTLKFSLPGFDSLTVKSIRISEDEKKSLPPLELPLGSMADCGGHAVLRYVRILPVGTRLGSVLGTVELYQEPPGQSGTAIAGADVVMLGANGRALKQTKTDSSGAFVFLDLPSGDFKVRASHKGFYMNVEPGYQVKEGLESTYESTYLERCPNGNCDPRLRPRKPPALCE